MNLNQAIEAYLSELELSQASVAHVNTASWLLHRFGKAVGETAVSELSPLTLVRFVRDARRQNGDPYSDATKNDFIAYLKSFASWLVSEGLHTEDVSARLKRHGYKVKREKLADENDLRRVMQSLDAYLADRNDSPIAIRDALVISFSNDSGGRLGEIHRLTVSGMTRALERPRRARNGTIVYHVDSYGKTRHVTLRFMQRTADLFYRWLDVRPAASSDMVFVNEEGRHVHIRTITAAFERLCKFADIPVFRTHAVRHLNGTAVLRSGGSINEAQGLLGHSSPATTARFYVHLVDEDIDDAAARIQEMRSKRSDEADQIARLFGLDDGAH